MFKKLINYFGGETPLLPQLRQPSYAAGPAYLAPDEGIRTYSTTFEVRRPPARATGYSEFSSAEQRACRQDELQAGFVRREAILARQALLPVGQEIMLNNSSALLGNNVSPMLRRMHDELLLKSILALDNLQPSGDELIFITLSPDALEHELVMRLPSHNVVLAFHPELESATKLVARCRQLRARGFRFAIDDFRYAADFSPLLGQVDYFRFNFAQMNISEVSSQLQQIPRLSDKKLIAKNVRTPEIVEVASRQLFDHCQVGRFDDQATPSTAPK